MRLPVQQVATISGSVGRVVAAASVNCAGNVLALLVAQADAARVFARDQNQGGASFARTRVDPPYKAILVEHDGHGVVRAVEIIGHLAFPDVQTFPDGGILIVGGRCQRFADGTAEANANVYTPEGEMASQFTAGDGIQHLRVDGNGRIWAGYFDEGVYGNFGWDQPIGASGIVRFDRTGEITWRYRPPEHGPWIDDCYALNVGTDEVWSCFYSDFPIVRIKDDQIAIWSNGVTGASALAACDSRVLLVGGYRENARRAVLTGLEGDQAVVLREYEMVLPTGADLAGARVLGVECSVYVLAANGSCFRIDVPDDSG